jgi:hypothetical protein
LQTEKFAIPNLGTIPVTTTTIIIIMGIIAVAGGSGNIGRTIVDAVLATKSHEVIVLARKVTCPLF